MTWAEKQSTDGGTLQMRVDYEYDVFGNRIEKAVDSDGDGNVDSTERYAYDGWQPGSGFTGNENWDIWADLDGSSSLTTRYVHGDAVDQLFARIGSGSTYWLLEDHLGSVRDIIDNTGAVKDLIAYDGYGNITSETNSAYRGRYTFNSREYDVETAFLYYRARYYSTDTGRWVTQDPLGFDAGDSNVYRYVMNKPTMARDPSGMAAARPNGDGTSTVVPPSEWPGGKFKLVPQNKPSNLLLNLFIITSSTGQKQLFDNLLFTEFRSQQLAAQLNALRAKRGLAPLSQESSIWWEAAKAGASGLLTGGKASINAAVDAVVGTITLGFVDNLEVIPVTEAEKQSGYGDSYMFGRVGWEIIIARLTGGASAGSKAGSAGSKIAKTIQVMDIISNGNLVAQGIQDMPIFGRTEDGSFGWKASGGIFGWGKDGNWGFQGFNLGNVLRVVGGSLGLTLNLRGAAKRPRAPEPEVHGPPRPPGTTHQPPGDDLVNNLPVQSRPPNNPSDKPLPQYMPGAESRSRPNRGRTSNPDRQRIERWIQETSDNQQIVEEMRRRGYTKEQIQEWLSVADERAGYRLRRDTDASDTLPPWLEPWRQNPPILPPEE